mmetsp:Transcript_36917/g.68994  ORF Transcript_36917/g.68994 Transcript_36917/m.68994 type:complete len:449 (-) Transcript_36917:95-1441(-)
MRIISLLLACWVSASSGRRIRVEPGTQQLSPVAQLLRAARGSTAWQAAHAGHAQRHTGCAQCAKSRTSAPVLGFGERGLRPGHGGSPTGNAPDKKLKYKVGQGYRKGGPLERNLVRVKDATELPSKSRNAHSHYPRPGEVDWVVDPSEPGDEGMGKGKGSGYVDWRKYQGMKSSELNPAERRMKNRGKSRGDEWEPERWEIDNVEDVEASYLPGGSFTDGSQSEFQMTLYDEATGRSMLVVMLEQLELDGKMYASFMPADAPVAILDEDLKEVDDEKVLDDIFPTAAYYCKDFDLILKRTPVELTVEGLDEREGTDADGFDAPYANDDEGIEMEELLDFRHRGKQYNLYRLLEPVFLIGRHMSGERFVIPDDEEMEEVSPRLLEHMYYNSNDEGWEPGWKKAQTEKETWRQGRQDDPDYDANEEHYKYFFGDEYGDYEDDEDIPDDEN